MVLQLDVLYMEWEDMYILSASQLYTSWSKNVFPSVHCIFYSYICIKWIVLDLLIRVFPAKESSLK